MKKTIPLLQSLLLGISLMAATAASGWAQVQYDTSPNAQTGEQIYGSYFKAGLDSVSLYNGNLNLNIGLLSLPGREISIGVSFTYDSQKWERHTCGEETCGSYAGGWRLAGPFGEAPTFWSTTGEFDAYWIDAAGAKHRYLLKPFDNNWENRTFPTVDSDGSILFTGDATTPRIHPFQGWQPQILYVPTWRYTGLPLRDAERKLSRPRLKRRPAHAGYPGPDDSVSVGIHGLPRSVFRHVQDLRFHGRFANLHGRLRFLQRLQSLGTDLCDPEEDRVNDAAQRKELPVSVQPHSGIPDEGDSAFGRLLPVRLLDAGNRCVERLCHRAPR